MDENKCESVMHQKCCSTSQVHLPLPLHHLDDGLTGLDRILQMHAVTFVVCHEPPDRPLMALQLFDVLHQSEMSMKACTTQTSIILESKQT